jgi:excisionase family DNA binding protein
VAEVHHLRVVDADPGELDLPRCLRVEEAAARLGVSTKTVRRWIYAGHLRAYRVDGRGLLLIPEDAVRELLDRSRVAGASSRRKKGTA